MKPEINALMLAGGRGIRMGTLTENAQKCMLPMEGRPIIGHIMEQLVSAFGSVDLRVAISYQGESVRDYIDHNKPNKVSATYISIPDGQDDYGACIRAEEYIRGTFLALPGDIVINSQAYVQVMELFCSNKVADVATTLSSLCDIANTHPVAKIQDLQVIKYLAKTPLRLDPDHLRDLMIFASGPKLFHYMKLYPSNGKYLGNVIEKIVREHRSLYAVPSKFPWLHIGYPEDLLKPLPI